VIRFGKAGNFWVGLSISRHTTARLSVYLGLTWWTLIAHVGESSR